MAEFTSLTLTNSGYALQIKAQAGTELQFTRVAIGDGTLDSDNLSIVTQLQNERMSITIANLSIENGSAVIKANFSNESLTESFYLRELGVFATDPDEGEILYAVAYAGDNGDYLPAYNGSEVIEQAFTLSLVVGAAANVTATFAESIYVLKAGDTMTGPLVLSRDPTENLGAATKQYVDNNDNNAVKKSGDTMTGILGLDMGLTIGTSSSVNTPYVDFNSSGNSVDYDVRLIASGGSSSAGTGTLNVSAGVLTKTATATNSSYNATSGTAYTIVDEYCRVWRAVFNDLAEMMPAAEDTQPGDICVWDETVSALRKATMADDPRVVGVHSDTFGFLLGGPNENSPTEITDHLPIGISGQVWVKSRGVKAGDLLTTSNEPGVAKASTEFIPGTVFAKALESAPDDQVTRIRALIMMR